MKFKISIILLIFFSGCDPRPIPTACRVISINTDYNVNILGSYGTSSYFGTSCSKKTPEEILIPANGYDVYMYFHHSARVFVGVESENSNYKFIADDWRETSPQSLYKRATHSKDLAALSGDLFQSHKLGNVNIYKTDSRIKINTKREIKFRVSDSSGNIIEHAYPFTIIDCTCKTYDAL